jgi:hypothetical protein
MGRSARYAVDSLDLQPKEIDCLYALIDNHGDRRTVTPEEFL